MDGGQDVLFEGLGEPAAQSRFEGETPIVQAVNDAFEATFGVSESEIVGDSLDEHIVPPDKETTAAKMNRAGAAGELVEREVCRQTPDGPRWFLFRSVPFEVDGEQHGYGIYVDITERKQQQERFQELIKHSTDIITVLDAGGTYQYQSPSAERVLGYDPERMVGDTAFDYVHPDDRERVMTEFADAVGEPDASPQVQYRFQHSNGSWQWLESFGNNQLMNPAVEGFVVNSRDISERVEFERELTLLKEVFSRVFRHNIRNKLNVIEGHADLALDHCDEEGRASLQKIRDTAAELIEHSRKARLIGKVVDARDAQTVDLAAHVREVVGSAHEAYPAVSFAVDVEPVQVRAHPELREAIRELIGNAITHAPPDHDLHIEVTAEQTAESVTLSVEDDAGGMREDEITVIEEERESELEHGSGVGLWLVKWITERSGGEMAIELTNGGTRVELALPLATGDESDGTGYDSSLSFDPAS